MLSCERCNYLDDVSVCSTLVGLAVLRVLEEYLVHVSAGVLCRERYVNWEKELNH